MPDESPPSTHRSDYDQRLAREQETYAGCINVHDLPPIFHYWSNKYLRPKLERYGFSSPDEFFRVYLMRLCQEAAAEGRTEPLRFVSIGAGNADLEVELVRRLVESGYDQFSVECQDINRDMLQRGFEAARQAGVSELMDFTKQDFNYWDPERKLDALLANQCLHHVTRLESLLDGIARSLKPSGFFLTSDMIGRNGHQRWPEALSVVRKFWQELPESYRYNHQLQRSELAFINHDCSVDGFEGIRAQDILPALVERFEFDLFIPFANVVDVFVDRSFGPNFDANSEADREFIDRVHAADERAIHEGRLTPTHMIAALKVSKVESPEFLDGLRPEACIRRPEKDKERIKSTLGRLFRTGLARFNRS